MSKLQPALYAGLVAVLPLTAQRQLCVRCGRLLRLGTAANLCRRCQAALLARMRRAP